MHQLSPVATKCVLPVVVFLVYSQYYCCCVDVCAKKMLEIVFLRKNAAGSDALTTKIECYLFVFFLLVTECRFFKALTFFMYYILIS